MNRHLVGTIRFGVIVILAGIVGLIAKSDMPVAIGMVALIALEAAVPKEPK